MSEEEKPLFAVHDEDCKNLLEMCGVSMADGLGARTGGSEVGSMDRRGRCSQVFPGLKGEAQKRRTRGARWKRVARGGGLQGGEDIHGEKGVRRLIREKRAHGRKDRNHPKKSAGPNDHFCRFWGGLAVAAEIFLTPRKRGGARPPHRLAERLLGCFLEHGISQRQSFHQDSNLIPKHEISADSSHRKASTKQSRRGLVGLAGSES